MAHEFEARMRKQMSDICLGTGEEIVDAQYFVAALDKPVDQMRTDKAGASGNQDPAGQKIVTRHTEIPLCFPFSIGTEECCKLAALRSAPALHFETARAPTLSSGAMAR
ncbi:hypothetical protein [Sphingopyxis sp. P1IMeth2]|uniref:hypothetical protein n=1 Tax=Sphingopyxis sp. P1IMeth2 TaxID=1892848 RepID=UPI00391D4576